MQNSTRLGFQLLWCILTDSPSSLSSPATWVLFLLTSEGGQELETQRWALWSQGDATNLPSYRISQPSTSFAKREMAWMHLECPHSRYEVLALTVWGQPLPPMSVPTGLHQDLGEVRATTTDPATLAGLHFQCPPPPPAIPQASCPSGVPWGSG